VGSTKKAILVITNDPMKPHFTLTLEGKGGS